MECSCELTCGVYLFSAILWSVDLKALVMASTISSSVGTESKQNVTQIYFDNFFQ